MKAAPKLLSLLFGVSTFVLANPPQVNVSELRQASDFHLFLKNDEAKKVMFALGKIFALQEYSDNTGFELTLIRESFILRCFYSGKDLHCGARLLNPENFVIYEPKATEDRQGHVQLRVLGPSVAKIYESFKEGAEHFSYLGQDTDQKVIANFNVGTVTLHFEIPYAEFGGSKLDEANAALTVSFTGARDSFDVRFDVTN